jgi:hypothetical protein
MKMIKYALPALLLGLLSGCGKLDQVTIGDPAASKAPVMTAHEPIVITGENLKTGTTTFTWTPADYGFAASPVNTVMISVGGGAPVELSSGQGKTAPIGYEALNNRVVAAGAVPDQANEVAFTVASSLTAEGALPLVSAPVMVKITPYMPPPSYLWIAGTLNIAAWEPHNPLAPKVTSPTPGTDYEGMVDLSSPGALAFKFCSRPNWEGTNYGGSKDALDPNGGDIKDLPGGYYRLIVNSGITRVATALKIETIGAIGNGVPGEWGSETKMTYDAQTNTWTIPSIAITGGGEFKLRINDNWDYAIGGTPDKAEFGLGNIVLGVSSGNYKMVLHAGQFPYRIELIKL